MAYRLRQISHANGNYTDGVVVRTDQDPRYLARNLDLADYKEKKALLAVRLGDKRHDHTKSLGGVKRQVQAIELIGCVSHHAGLDEAGLNLDDVRERLVHDVTWEIHNDQTMTRAAADLGISPKPSCIALEVNTVRVNPVTRFPHTDFMIELTYQYEDRGSASP